ncbi:unnamed protein product [Echinostoma caproni]|uniref:Endo/exonuclease/phosphatase domain-containing protein n=1 Tax=Echinostoma caproni TaxID=27848 RepID=A0A183B6J5_9TREM|nr:unnamed protein product [Echinostoma caproni]
MEPSCNTGLRVFSGVHRRDAPTAAIDRRSRACIVSTNVRSVLNKRNELDASFMEHSPMATALIEAWLNPDALESEVSLSGCASFRSDRVQPGMGGRVMLFIDESVPVTHLHSYADPDGQERGVVMQNQTLLQRLHDDWSLLQPPETVPVAILDDMRRRTSDGHCRILGDFNVPLIDWDENRCLPGADRFSKDLLAVVNQLTMHQNFLEPTRLNDSAHSVLDLVLSPRTSDVDVIDYLRDRRYGISDSLFST